MGGEGVLGISAATVFKAVPAGHRLDRASPTGDPLRLPDPMCIRGRQYADQFNDWVQGNYHSLPLSLEGILAAAVHTQIVHSE